jgi:hypothetical protein
MTRLPQDKVDFIRANRSEPPKKLAQALEVPVRHVNRVLRELGDRDAIRSARRRLVLRTVLGLALLVAAGYGVKRWLEDRGRKLGLEDARQKEQEARKAEQGIYQLLDKHEAGHDDEVAKKLLHEDEAVRLASVRYLLTQGRGTQLFNALQHVSDPSRRVRLATIQMAADVPAASVDDVFLNVAADKTRDLAERKMAFAGLKKRPIARLRPVIGPKLLELLSEPQPALRKDAHDVLALAFPEAKVAYSEDALALRTGWQNWLEVRH